MKTSAFSLIEVLVVIAIIGILSAIALPFISNVSQAADNTRIVRNAQTLASTYNSAIAAGVPMTAASDLDSAVVIITAGTNVSINGNVQSFSVNGLTTEEIDKAKLLLSFSNGLIAYNP